jgi:hypothetical protein
MEQPETSSSRHAQRREEDEGDEEEHEEEEDEEEEDVDFSDYDSFSSISDSSIIDLPPPLSPNRIIPPTSLSIPRALNLAALDNSPVLGPLVRRSRSARFLARSFGAASHDLESAAGDPALAEGRGRTVSAAVSARRDDHYGTFG